jgi:nucleotide-binding universal stress UspA family protein
MDRVPLLLPFDGSPAALRAVELLAGYRGAASLAITALNVQARPVTIWPESMLDAREVEAALLEAGAEELRPALARLPGAEGVVRLGFPADSIVREAPSLGAGLIVMGTRGHGALHGFPLGSVALRVAHGSPVPTLLVKPEARLPARFGAKLNIVVGMDGSEAALRALAQVASWRPWLGELQVELVYVQQPLGLLARLLPPHDDVIHEWSSTAGEAAASRAREILLAAGISHRLHLSVGDAPTELALLAEQTQAELMVLGTRGLGAAHHALIGSVALKAASLATVPVLLVR